MNTNKFKKGNNVIIKGIVLDNDGTDAVPYEVLIGEDKYWFDEEYIDTPQQPTSQQYNRGQMAATILAGTVSNSNYKTDSPVNNLIEASVGLTDLLISELNKTNQ